MGGMIIVLSVVSFALSFVGASIGLMLGQLRLLLLIFFLGSLPGGIGTNLAISAMGAMAGAFQHIRRGHVSGRLVAVMGLPSGLAAFAASTAASHVDQGWTSIAVGLVLSSMGSYALLDLRRGGQCDERANAPTHRHILVELATGIGLGAIAGVVGLMMGGLRSTAMIRYLGVEPRIAIGTNLVIGAVTGRCATLATLAADNMIDVNLLLVAAPATMFGAMLGARFSAWLPREFLVVSVNFMTAGSGIFLFMRGVTQVFASRTFG